MNPDLAAQPEPISLNLTNGLVFVGIGLAAGAVARSLVLPAAHCASMWLFGGVFLAALLLTERRSWMRWSLLALATAFVINTGIQRAPALIAIVDATGHIAGMLLAAWLIRRYGSSPFRLNTLRDVLLLVVCTAVPGALVSASVESGISLVGHGAAPLMEWIRNWTSAAAGIVAASVLLSLAGCEGKCALWASGRRIEALLLMLALALACHLVFSTRLPIVFVLLPFLVWLALRFDMAAMTVGLALTAAIALHHTALGWGPYAASLDEPDVMAILVQLFVFVAVCGGLVLSVVIVQRRSAAKALHQTQSELEDRVRARTAALHDSERSLRENEERFRLARAAARLIVVDWDIVNDKLTYSDSPVWFRGPLPASGSYPLLKDQIHPDDREQFLRDRQKAIHTLRGGVAYYRIVRTDGVVLHIQSYRAVFPGADGKAARLVAIQQDITERRRAEIALRDSEARLRTVLDTIPDQVRLRDTEGRYVMVNRAAREHLGCPEEAIIGRTIHDLRPREIAQQIDAMDKALAAKGELTRVERQSFADPAIWREEIAAPMRSGDGRVTGVVSISRDISERKQAEVDTLREREERYRSLVEQATDLIYQTDSRGYFIYSNASATTDMLGYTRDELIGKHYLEFVRPDHREQTQRFYEHQFAQRIPSTYLEVPAVAKDGRTVWVGQRVQLVMENNWLLYHHVVCRDITERVAAQQALRDSNDKLRQLAAREEALLEAERVRLAHDLHDGIGQSIHLARIKLSDMMNRRDAGQMEGGLQEVMRVIDETSAVIRTLEFDLSPPLLRELGLEPALEWLAEEMERVYGLRVGVSSDGQAKPLKQTRRTVVFRSVRELLINVARHAGTREAYVDTQRDGDALVVTVSDEGKGYDVTRTARGLGLTGVQERFEHLGGIVVVESVLGEGTVIRLSLPLELEGETS